jgi:hypothetical protein
MVSRRSFSATTGEPFPAAARASFSYIVFAKALQGARTSDIQLKLYDNSSKNITPGQESIYDGYFTLQLNPGSAHPPFASFVILPNATVGFGKSLTFDASGSMGGFNGYAWVPITEYIWDFGDGTELTTSASKTTCTFVGTGTYQVTLIVQDADLTMSAPIAHNATVTTIANTSSGGSGRALLQ